MYVYVRKQMPYPTKILGKESNKSDVNNPYKKQFETHIIRICMCIVRHLYSIALFAMYFYDAIFRTQLFERIFRTQFFERN